MSGKSSSVLPQGVVVVFHQSVNWRWEKNTLAASGASCGCGGSGTPSAWVIGGSVDQRTHQACVSRRRCPLLVLLTRPTRRTCHAVSAPCWSCPPTWLASTSEVSMGCTPRLSSLRQNGFLTGSSFNLHRQCHEVSAAHNTTPPAVRQPGGNLHGGDAV